MSLKVGIIGCGIAGLSTAIALSRAGHDVELFEKSKFKNEVGAAILIGPNGTRILTRWGFDFDKAGALDCTQMRRFRADTIELDSEEHYAGIKEAYGNRLLQFHRADLHTGLKELVEQQVPTPKIHLATPIAAIDQEAGTITLASGDQVEKDLIVVADGAHSELMANVIGHPCPVTKSPMSMYRFLQKYSDVMSRPEAAQFYEGYPSGFTVFYKTEVGRPGLLLSTYPCRGGELLYCALVHPTKPKEKGLQGWDSPADYQDVISDAAGFHPSVQAICKDVTDVKVYTQMWRDPQDHLTRGRAVLVGDAGHLMLPTHGQGASTALEDAMALEVLFSVGGSPENVGLKLKDFEKLRLPRVSAVQTMSNKMMGPPDKMISEVKRYYGGGDIPGPKAKTFSKEYNDFFFLYDIESEAKKLLKSPD